MKLESNKVVWLTEFWLSYWLVFFGVDPVTLNKHRSEVLMKLIVSGKIKREYLHSVFCGYSWYLES